MPVLPVFVDSPMAMEALARYTERQRARPRAATGEARRQGSARRCRPRAGAEAPGAGGARAAALRVLHDAAPHHRVIRGIEAAHAVADAGDRHLVERDGHGGRVLHHLKDALPNPRNTVLLVGFQAEGTRGRQLVDGARSVKIHGQDIPVHAVVDKIESMSAHADSTEILRWLGGFQAPPKRTFLVHGEPQAMDPLAGAIRRSSAGTCTLLIG